MSDLLKALGLLAAFHAGSLKRSVARVEARLTGSTHQTIQSHLAELGINVELLLAAMLVKKNSAQINEIVHAIGILVALPKILEEEEIIESLSLAAGNSGKGFDLETSHRIAEFTFIQWQGGAEVIRQNKILKDFYFLAEADTNKRRELYVIGVKHPQKFFESGRSLAAILKGNNKLGTSFGAKHGDSYRKVRDYYDSRRHLVAIRDLGSIIPSLLRLTPRSASA